MMQHFAIFGSSNERKGGNALGAILVAIFMPLGAMLIQLAISRSREYLADETGAQYCHDPLALASALEKLHTHSQYAHLDNNHDARKASTASLFIINPFSSSGLIALFSTHPPMHERIKRLRQMHGKMF
jgi:heat shock protein HtpX